MHQHPIRFEACSPAKGLVFSVEQMRRVDAFAIDELGLPGLILMEHASIALRVACGELAPTDAPACVLVGPGNNGGDGLALARLLHTENPARSIRCVLLAPGKSSNDGAANLRVLESLRNHSDGCLRIAADLPDQLDDDSLVIDAMFGSGLDRPLEGRFEEAVRWTEAQHARGCRVLAVDVPSGLDADTGEPVQDGAGRDSPTVRADRTVTLGGVKRGLLRECSRARAGEVSVGDIGVPRWVLERFGEPIGTEIRAEGGSRSTGRE